MSGTRRRPTAQTAVIHRAPLAETRGCLSDLELALPLPLPGRINGDADQASASLQLARRLLGRQAVWGDSDPVRIGEALQRTCARVCDSLRDTMGVDGCIALLTRALAEVRTKHPALRDVRPSPGAGVYLDGVQASIEAHGIATATAAIEALLVALIDILGRLIGGDMAVRLIDNDAPRPRIAARAQAP